ncbi:hypothetical protein [Fusobacterium periodonticum]|uniref:hypothetical protein n=1 Tax=Fusobacterium periodonticum TaxID=860 RepID=UPI0028D3F348|nr:hypothetical protein [Fusobacterium periodonticum]
MNKARLFFYFLTLLLFVFNLNKLDSYYNIILITIPIFIILSYLKNKKIDYYYLDGIMIAIIVRIIIWRN